MPLKLSTSFPLKLDKTDSKVICAGKEQEQSETAKRKSSERRVVLSDILKYYKAQIIKMAQDTGL